MDDWRDSFAESELFAGMPAEWSSQVLNAARSIHVPAGTVLFNQGDPGASMYLVAEGRLRIQLTTPNGDEKLLNVVGPGGCLGELSLLHPGPRTASVSADMDSHLLEIGQADFERLTREVPLLGRNIGRVLGQWLREAMSGIDRRRRVEVIAVVHSSRRTHAVAVQFVRELAARGHSVLVWSDAPERWPAGDGFCVEARPDDHGPDAVAHHPGWLARQVMLWDHVVVDMNRSAICLELLRQCEETWWIAEAEESDASVNLLRDVVRRWPALEQRLLVAWLISERRSAPRLPAPLDNIVVQQMRMQAESNYRDDAVRRADATRLVHRARGLHLGLALGGGGALGAAHIGVLRAFERNGIYFDRIAGTSFGSVVAAAHAAGYKPDETLRFVLDEMVPPWNLARFPKVETLFLLALFRFGRIERILRKHLFNDQFDQLLLPLHSVCVDMISGHEVVRSEGDVVHALCESANLPIFNRPIRRNGQALVDGFVLNNLPTDVLRRHNANLVVAVDVSPASVSPDGKKQLRRERSKGVLDSLFRILEIATKGHDCQRLAQANCVITPYLLGARYVEFDRAGELAEAGEKAAEDAISRIRKLLAESDSLDVVQSPRPASTATSIPELQTTSNG